MKRARIVFLVAALSACAEPSAPAPRGATQPPPPRSETIDEPAPRAARTIERIRITVRPTSGGMATREFLSDGVVHGAHLSGDNPPRAYQEDGASSPEERAALWQAAEDAIRALGETSEAEGASQGQTQITIAFSDGTSRSVHWPTGADPPTPEVQRLSQLMTQSGVGAWERRAAREHVSSGARAQRSFERRQPSAQQGRTRRPVGALAHVSSAG